MPAEPIDYSDAIEWQEDLPRPRWDLIASRIGGMADADHAGDVWTAAARWWLERLGESLGSTYVVEESPRALLLVSRDDSRSEFLLAFVAECRRVLQAALPGVADFRDPGKAVLIILNDEHDYYRYVTPFCPEGRSGGSSGMEIREGYPHVAAWGADLGQLERIVAHEMTHAALSHLTMPQWIEEGLAQMFERDMAGRGAAELDGRSGRQHKQVWGRRGLDEFWFGTGFHSAGRVQQLSYQLAEVLVRLLVEEHRPGWLGWGRSRRERLLEFLRCADASDAGESAARERLRLGLDEIAARFLGPGDWKPRCVTGESATSEPRTSPQSPGGPHLREGGTA